MRFISINLVLHNRTNLNGMFGEKGNIAFYVAFVIPISLILLIIVLDISQWQFLRERAQKDADKISLEIANALPYESLTQDLIQEKILDYNYTSANLKISEFSGAGTSGTKVNPDSVSIAITGRHESITDTLLSAVTGKEVVLDVFQTSTARVVPYDLMLLFSDAISLRPNAYTTFGTLQEFPQSEYFNLISVSKIRVTPPPMAPRSWPNWWEPATFNDLTFKRWATQLCYNPITIPLKQALLMLVDQIGSSEKNRIGVYASPGDAYQGVGYSVVKEFDFMGGNNNNVRWSSYFEPDTPLSDEACLLYADTEIGMQRYAIPELNTFLTQGSTCEARLIKNPFSSPLGHYPNPLSSHLSPCYTQTGGATVREAIYYRAVRMHSHEVNASNISRTIAAALSQIIEAEKIDPEAQINFRRGLSSDTNKIIVVVSDAVPAITDESIKGVIKLIDSLENFKFYFFFYNHQGIDAATKSLYSSQIQSYKSAGRNRFIAEVTNEADILNHIRALLINEKRVVISL